VSGYLLRRLGQAALLLWAAATLVFLMTELAPGDPFSMGENPSVDPRQAQELRALYRLDRPAPQRYLDWLAAASRGDWGISLRARRPVAERLSATLPASAALGLAALAVALSGGGLLGLLQVRLRESGWAGAATERWIDRAALLLYCLPTFWVGLGLIDIFSYRLGWLPPSHLTPAGAATPAGLSAAAPHWILPVLTLALAPGAAIARHLRASLEGTGPEGFVQAARARGAGASAVLARHRLRVSLAPVLALAGLHLPHLAGGTLLVEVVFALPGTGRLAYEAALGRDYPVLMATTVLVSLAVIGGGLVADLVQAWADPRLRNGQAAA
jgi:peptide/nickel transport system permease protein